MIGTKTISDRGYTILITQYEDQSQGLRNVAIIDPRGKTCYSNAFHGYTLKETEREAHMLVGDMVAGHIIAPRPNIIAWFAE
jgi:hypothetical protein